MHRPCYKLGDQEKVPVGELIWGQECSTESPMEAKFSMRVM